MARILLIHGAWSRGSFWGEVPALLAAMGHEVAAPDLPGHGGDPTPPETLRLADYAQAVAGWLAEGPPALLVGHSMGGMAISAAAELAPERIAGLAYLCAFLPRDGESLIDLMARQRVSLRPALRPGPAPGTSRLDPEAAAPFLCQDAEPEAAARFLAALGPQANAPQTDPVHLTEARFGSRPRAYILCEEDATITPALQRAMIAESPCAPVLTLPTGHFPQLTAPYPLALHIDALARL